MPSKHFFITIDRFGEDLTQASAAALSLSACSFRNEPGSWERLADELVKLGAGPDPSGVRLCVVADLGVPECSKVLRKLTEHLQERLWCPLDHAYVVLPQRGGSDGGTIFGAGSLFKRVFILSRDGSSGEGVEPASRVLKAHGISELGAVLNRSGAPAAVHAAAWLFSSPGGEFEIEPEFKEMHLLLKDAIEAVDTIVEDLKGRIERMLEMVESMGRKEISVYQAAVPEIKELVSSLGEKEFKPGSIDWGMWLATLPRGLEVKVKLALALDECGSRPLRPEEVKGALPKPKGDENWDLETEVVAAILHDFVPVEIKKWWNPIPPVLREEISFNCRRLLRALDSPLIRRRMLESLLYYVLTNHKGNGVQIAAADGMASVRDELRRHLQQARGGGVFLILPKNSMEERRRHELRDWIEQVMGSPCEIMLKDGDEAWLYVETPYEARPAAFQEAPRQVVEVPAKEGREGDGGSSSWTEPEPEPPPPLPPSGHCKDCGAPFSEPRLNLPPNPGATPRNGSRPRKTCPTCGRLNSKAWWVCWNHSKAAPVLIPIDKVRCPDCILSHHQDPEGFPLSKISVRPGYREPLNCPNCENMKRLDPGHPIFEVPENLARFYRDGVNGHDSVHFREIVRESGLLGDCYCPNCGTLLIPVHHRQRETQLPS